MKRPGQPTYKIGYLGREFADFCYHHSMQRIGPLRRTIRLFAKRCIPALVLVAVCVHQVDAQRNVINPSIRLITYNVWYGFIKVPDRHTNFIRWMIYQEPDIVCLQELNDYTPMALERDAGQWGHQHTVLLKEDGFPTGITSRFPIEDVTRVREGFHHGLIRVRIKGVYIYVIHLHPSDHEVRSREMKLIVEDIGKLPTGKVILAGDFNALSPLDSIFYDQDRLTSFFGARDKDYGEKNLKNGGLDYQVLRNLASTGFVDSEARYRGSGTFTGTFPTQIEKEGEHGDSRRLDYIFLQQAYVDKLLHVEVADDPVTLRLSDHLPVVADFSSGFFDP